MIFLLIQRAVQNGENEKQGICEGKAIKTVKHLLRLRFFFENLFIICFSNCDCYSAVHQYGDDYAFAIFPSFSKALYLLSLLYHTLV